MADSYLQKLDPALLKLATTMGCEAAKFGCHTYLVGGIVRDLILGRKNTDLDIVVEGHAIGLARRLADVLRMQMIEHPEFMTATLMDPKGRRIDFATSRREFYPHPGALPVVDEGNLQSDMFRRDFTINALVLSLYPDSFGQLIDLYGGLADLKNGKIKVFHAKSFIDDPTRLLRAVRFEQRFSFDMEEATATYFKEAIRHNVLRSISAPRYFLELRKILCENDPLQPLKRLHQLKLLRVGGVSLGFNARSLVELQRNLRKISKKSWCRGYERFWLMYLIDLLDGLSTARALKIVQSLQLKKEVETAIIQAKDHKRILKQLQRSTLTKSDVYRLLSGQSFDALLYFRLKSANAQAGERLDQYIGTLRHAKLLITGDDVKKMGVSSGKKIGRILEEALYCKIDGGIRTKKQELMVAREILNEL